MALQVQYSMDNNSNNGVIRLVVPDQTNPTSNKIHIVFVLDGSGSMDQMAGDQKTKMMHLKHTVRNSLDYISNAYKSAPADAVVLVSIFLFDHEVRELGLYINIRSDDELRALKFAVDKLEPRGSTNIGLALQKVAQGLETTSEIYGDDMRRAQIFLTDGLPTDGDHNAERLATMVCTDYPNAFIGYGTDHNYQLLRTLGNLSGADYWFAESYERAGMVYGEVCHKILYAHPQTVELKTKGEGNEVYDPRTGTWTSRLKINMLAAGDAKTYHIRSTVEGGSMSVTYLPSVAGVGAMYAWEAKQIDPDAVDTPAELNQQGISLMVWRGKVLEYLQKTTNVGSASGERADLHKEGSTLLEELKEAAKTDEWAGNVAFRQLQDDVYVAIQSLQCAYGGMYAGARQRSLGSQRAYNVCDLGNMTPSRNLSAAPSSAVAAASACRAPSRQLSAVPRRTSSVSAPSMTPREGQDGTFTPPEMVCMGEVGDSPHHVMSQDAQSCFASPGVASAMRQCSVPTHTTP